MARVTRKEYYALVVHVNCHELLHTVVDLLKTTLRMLCQHYQNVAAQITERRSPAARIFHVRLKTPQALRTVQ